MGSDLSTVHGVPGQWYQVPGQAATRGHAGASAAEIHQTNATYFISASPLTFLIYRFHPYLIVNVITNGFMKVSVRSI